MKRPYRVVVAKPGLDGHDRGAKVIARAFRDAGFEVIYTGLHQTPEQVVQAVVQEDADAVGLSLLSGAHLTLVPRVIDGLREQGLDDVVVIVGGIIPEGDIPALKDLGVAAVFTPGASLDTMVHWLADALDEPGGGRRRGLSHQDADQGLSKSSAERRAPAARRRRRRGVGPAVDLYEYQGKQYFARYGIPTSPGGVADTVDEALSQAEAAGYPVVVKAQVKVGGRGKAGGIKLADNADEVRTYAAAILGMDIHGHVVQRLWVEHASDIAREYYASFTLDRAAKLHLCMVSAKGGVEIEEVAATDPGAIAGCTSTRSTDSPSRPRPAWWRRRSSTSRPGRRRRSSLWRCTGATSRATATWPRSTR